MRVVTQGLVLAALFAPPALATDGKAVFEEVCAACHQAGGVGAPGLAPPLVDPELWQRLGDKAPQYVAGVLVGGLSGTITAGGEKYVALVMPPQEGLDDATLAAVGTYVLKDLNATGHTVGTALIAATRGAVPSHGALRTMRKGGTP